MNLTLAATSAHTATVWKLFTAKQRFEYHTINGMKLDVTLSTPTEGIMPILGVCNSYLTMSIYVIHTSQLYKIQTCAIKKKV